MRMMKRLAWTMPGVVLAGAAVVVGETPEAAGAVPPERWGVIARNTLGSPTAELRFGPYGRTTLGYSARQPPPYGRGSLGIVVGSKDEKVAYGNETNFAGTPLSRIGIARYWVYNGVDPQTSTTPPSLAMEVDPRIAGQNYTTLVYLPSASISPSAPSILYRNVWQEYDATAPGNKWFATNTAVADAIGCGLASPCSFATLKSRLPYALISYSVAIQKGRDDAFAGAVDGLRLNNVLFDFERGGVRRRSP